MTIVDPVYGFPVFNCLDFVILDFYRFSTLVIDIRKTRSDTMIEIPPECAMVSVKEDTQSRAGIGGSFY